jgi:hypothetical protein
MTGPLVVVVMMFEYISRRRATAQYVELLGLGRKAFGVFGQQG